MSAPSPQTAAPPGTSQSCLMSTYAPPAVTFATGSGSWLIDTEGRRYLDLLSGLAVTSLGHAHPAVAATLAEQSGALLHVSNLFGNVHNGPLAAELDDLLGGGGQVFFANSGAEANECAIKVARKHGGTDRHVVISADGSFHGRTLATLHATGQPAKHEGFEPLPEGFRHVPWGDAEALAAAIDGTVAAVLLEPIQGEGGVIPAPAGYLQAVRSLCDQHGILLMIDEIQTGLGRSGAWFAHQLDGVRPDVVTMAKALGNGVPIGACWATHAVAASMTPGDHGSTFGGQPLAAAAARTVVGVMRSEDVPARARRAGERLTAALSSLDGVLGVRGRGLLLGVELDRPAGPVAASMLSPGVNINGTDGVGGIGGIDGAERIGVIVNAVTPTALRLAPSLLITDDEIDLAATLIGRALSQQDPEGSR